MLGLEGTIHDQGWQWSPEATIAGTPFDPPTPLFTKLDESVADEEIERIRQ